MDKMPRSCRGWILGLKLNGGLQRWTLLRRVKEATPPWAPSSGQQNSLYRLSSRSFLALAKRERKESLRESSRDSSLRGLQELQDPGERLVPQALLGLRASLGTVVYRALLASQESLALMESAACRAQ